MKNTVYFRLGGFVYIALCALLFLTVALPGSTNAQTAGFVVSPAKIELEVVAGSETQAAFTITNGSDATQTFSFSTEDVTGTADGVPAELLGEATGPYSLKEYLGVPQVDILVAPGESARIPVTVALPEIISPGGRYGSVLVSALPVDGEVNGAATKVVSRIGVLFFVTTPGDVIVEGSLRDFKPLPSATIVESLPGAFAVRFENTGVTHLNPYGRITLTDRSGRVVAETTVDPWYVLPEALRFTEVRLDELPEASFGKYTATLELNRGYQDIIDTQQIVIWVVPIWLRYIGLAAGVLLAVWVLYRIVRRWQ